MKDNKIHLIGYASGIAGVDNNVGRAPFVIQNSPYIKEKNTIFWDTIVEPSESFASGSEEVARVCKALAVSVSHAVKQNKRVTVLGGDHTCAIGTWNGVYDVISEKGELGLIWIDAHMDSHTPLTSESGRIHGMPLACLLGQGYASLSKLMSKSPVIKPENLCLIGVVRSYEAGEAAFLKNLNVKIYFIEEVKERGLINIFKEARNHVSQNTVGYGISLDLDAIDPKQAPGVDVPEENGLDAKELLKCLAISAEDEKLLASEIVEFDFTRDKNALTEKLMIAFIHILNKGS